MRKWSTGTGALRCDVELREEKPLKVSKTDRNVGKKLGTGRGGTCVAGVTFGCHAQHAGEQGTMWVRDGCRGLFFCNKAKTGICGYGMPDAVGFMDAIPQRAQINCSCAHELAVRNEANKAWWRSRAKPVTLRLFDRASRPPSSPRWLLAASIACGSGDDGALARSDVANFGGDSFHLWFNIYDGVPASRCLPSRMLSLPFVHTSQLPGYMTLFWKHVLTPAVTGPFDVIMLKDGDILLSPHTFVPAEVEHWMTRTNASIITPSIVPRGRGHRSGRSSIASHPLWADCIAVASPYAEQVIICSDSSI